VGPARRGLKNLNVIVGAGGGGIKKRPGDEIHTRGYQEGSEIDSNYPEPRRAVGHSKESVGIVDNPRKG